MLSLHDSGIVAEIFVGLQVLVVQEKNGLLRGTGVWKFPTGVVDEVCANFRPEELLFIFIRNRVQSKSNQQIKLYLLQGEDICAAAVREVKEETGVSSCQW